MKTIHIHGANLLDNIFTITLSTGEVVSWNVTKLCAAAQAGAFGAPRFMPTADLPPADWSEWGEEDRAKVDSIKSRPDILDQPAIAIASQDPGYLASCFADGQHRITARQELGLSECPFYLVPLDLERKFRVDGLEQLGSDR